MARVPSLSRATYTVRPNGVATTPDGALSARGLACTVPAHTTSVSARSTNAAR